MRLTWKPLIGCPRIYQLQWKIYCHEYQTEIARETSSCGMMVFGEQTGNISRSTCLVFERVLGSKDLSGSKERTSIIWAGSKTRSQVVSQGTKARQQALQTGWRCNICTTFYDSQKCMIHIRKESLLISSHQESTELVFGIFHTSPRISNSSPTRPLEVVTQQKRIPIRQSNKLLCCYATLRVYGRVLGCRSFPAVRLQ